MEKIYKFAVSLFFLCCVLVPVFDIRGISLNLKLSSSSSSAQTNTELQKTLEQQKIDQTQTSISALIRQICVNNSTTPLDVTTTATIDNSGAISTISAVVTLKSSEMTKKNDLISAVKEELGIDIIVKEGESSG